MEDVDSSSKMNDYHATIWKLRQRSKEETRENLSSGDSTLSLIRTLHRNLRNASVAYIGTRATRSSTSPPAEQQKRVTRSEIKLETRLPLKAGQVQIGLRVYEREEPGTVGGVVSHCCCYYCY